MKQYKTKGGGHALAFGIGIGINILILGALTLTPLGSAVFQDEPLTVVDAMIDIDAPEPPVDPDYKPKTDIKVDLPTPEPLPEPTDNSETIGAKIDPTGQPGEGGPMIDPGRPATKPVYPMASIRLGEEGTVTLNILVGADGAVEDIEVVESSGHKRLDDAAIKWALSQKWRPAMKNGKPVRAWKQQSVTFRLKDL